VKVFITGITGTLGRAIAELHQAQGDEVYGCARNEARAVAWRNSPGSPGSLCVGDCADLADPSTQIGTLLPQMDKVYHCAALKHVDVCEAYPYEAFHQNVEKTNKIACACALSDVPLVFISSDKACLPQGVYGATKLMAERVVLHFKGAVVRLGNLIGSSGSVFTMWREAAAAEELICLTDPKMTRFFMRVNDAAMFAVDSAVYGHVSVPVPLYSAVMGDLARAIAGSKVRLVGPRLGETRHQYIVAPGDRLRAGHDPNRHTIDETGQVVADGISSERAPRWDTYELLRAAGIEGQK
jgi:UDP-N-acetylglucosamine 4,6-dehydratase/5-epimerase